MRIRKFVLGLGLALLSGAVLGQAVLVSQTVNPAAGTKGTVTFRPDKTWEFETDHIRLGFTDYIPSDGGWLRVLYLTKTDQSQADIAFDHTIASQHAVIWTPAGANFHEVGANSLQHGLQFEAHYRY